MAEKTMKNRRVLLFPFPFQGHINPMLELAAVLHSRSFSITIFHTDYNYEAVHPAKYPSYRFVTIPDRISKLTSSSQDHVLSLIRLLNDNCTMPFHEILAQVLSESDRESSVPCLVLDMHWYKINPVAKLLGVPTLVLGTGSATNLNGFITLPALYRKGIVPSKAEWELELAVEELPLIRVRDMIAVGNDPEQLLNFVLRGAKNVRSSSGIIINTSQAMEGAELEKLQCDLALPAFTVGPLHKHDKITQEAAGTNTSPSSCTLKLLNRDQDRLCMEWLDSHPPKSVLYVSFESLASMDPKDFTEMAWGLADSGQPFLWVVRLGSVESIPHVEMALPAVGGLTAPLPASRMDHQIDILDEQISGSQYHQDSSRFCPEKELMMFIVIKFMVELMASGLGMVKTLWATVMLPKNYLGLITLMLLFEGIQIFCRSNKLVLYHKHKMQQLPYPIHFISRLLYWLEFISVITSGVLSVTGLTDLLQHKHSMQHDFRKSEEAMVFYVFYVMTISEILVLLAARVIWKVSYCRLLKKVQDEYVLDATDMDSVKLFFYDVYSKCVQDGSIIDALKMDLVTFAGALFVSNSREEQLSGASILKALSTHPHYFDVLLRKIGRSKDVVERLKLMLNSNNLFEENIIDFAVVIASKIAHKHPNLFEAK